MSSKKSLLSLIILVAVVLGAVGFLLGTLVTAGSAGTRVAGTNVGPGSVWETPVPVVDFTLTDQQGKSFTFSSTKGKVVLMAFLFTHCADVCPFEAIKMKLAVEQLGARGQDVELVVISTDPERDTVPVIAAYSEELGLYDRWHYVTGAIEDLQKLYKDLKITVIKAEEEEVEQSVKNAAELGLELPSGTQADSPVYGLSEGQIRVGSEVAKKFSGGYNIAHAAPFWVVDRTGRIRTSLDVAATPGQLAEALKAYLK